MNQTESSTFFEKIPTHVALVMDGNLRWAKTRGVPYIEGLRAGARAIEPIVERAGNLGVKHITFWALSTENWKRGEEFTDNLFTVFREFLAQKELFDRLVEKGGELHVFGDITELPDDVQKGLEEYLLNKPEDKKIDVNFCLNYGGRAEIIRAVKKIVDEGVKSTDVTEKTFSKYFYTANQSDPDLVIRTSGEQRLSGFMPWQAVYAEYYFAGVLWPDFTPHELDEAFREYAHRDRRFGMQKS